MKYLPSSMVIEYDKYIPDPDQDSGFRTKRRKYAVETYAEWYGAHKVIDKNPDEYKLISIYPKYSH